MRGNYRLRAEQLLEAEWLRSCGWGWHRIAARYDVCPMTIRYNLQPRLAAQMRITCAERIRQLGYPKRLRDHNREERRRMARAEARDTGTTPELIYARWGIG
jgi:hypothetical protein